MNSLIYQVLHITSSDNRIVVTSDLYISDCVSPELILGGATWKLSRRASELVLDGSLSKVLPVKSEIKIQLEVGWTSAQILREDFLLGTVKAKMVQMAFVFLVCCINLTGGHHQLFSFPQSTVKVLTASISGVQNLELNRSTCLLCKLANLSIK